MGRERGTAVIYADDADKAGDGAIAGALRQRAKRHELCEQLALGGFEQLQAGVNDISTFMQGEQWPVRTQKMWTKRQIKELCSKPGALNIRWTEFENLSFC